MSQRTGHRARIRALEAFVRAWDDFINASQKVGQMSVTDENRTHAQGVVKVKQTAVQRLRAEIGQLDG